MDRARERGPEMAWAHPLKLPCPLSGEGESEDFLSITHNPAHREEQGDLATVLKGLKVQIRTSSMAGHAAAVAAKTPMPIHREDIYTSATASLQPAPAGP